MRITKLVICVALLFALQLPSGADMVTEWNNNTLDAIAVGKIPPPQASRLLAMVHIAIFDAINAIDRQYHPYYVMGYPKGPASADAAIATAAYTVLVNEAPTLNKLFAKERLASLNQIPNGIYKNNGISWGVYVGSVISYIRKNDFSTSGMRFKTILLPGLWRPTPPSYTPALAPNWVHVTPFAIPSANYFDPGPPYGILTNEYAANVNYTKEWGAINSAVRTPDQTQTAFFWDDPGGTISPAGRWNKIAQTIAAQYNNTELQNARMFALLNIALADTCIAAWYTKYHYDLWRPITAIREANVGGNPLVVQDPFWTPLLVTPPFPEYLPGHSVFPGGGAEVLALFFGKDDISFSVYSEVIHVTRSYSSLSQAAEEEGMSRIYAGIHYPFSDERGLEIGRDIGKYVFEHELTPL